MSTDMVLTRRVRVPNVSSLRSIVVAPSTTTTSPSPPSNSPQFHMHRTSPQLRSRVSLRLLFFLLSLFAVLSFHWFPFNLAASAASAAAHSFPETQYNAEVDADRQPHVYFRVERKLISATGAANQCKNDKCVVSSSSSSSSAAAASEDDQGDGNTKKKSSSTGGDHSSSSTSVHSAGASSTGGARLSSSTSSRSSTASLSTAATTTQKSSSSTATLAHVSSSSSTAVESHPSSSASVAPSSTAAAIGHDSSSAGADASSTGEAHHDGNSSTSSVHVSSTGAATSTSAIDSSTGSDSVTGSNDISSSSVAVDSSTSSTDSTLTGVIIDSSTAAAGGDSSTASIADSGSASTSKVPSSTAESTTTASVQSTSTSDFAPSSTANSIIIDSSSAAAVAPTSTASAASSSASASDSTSSSSSSGASSSFSTLHPTTPSWSSSSTGASYTFCSGDWCLHGSGNEHNDDGTYTETIVFGISMKLQLQLTMEEWNANKSGNEDRFKKDLADTIDPAIASSRIKVNGVEAGSVVVNFDVLPGAGVEPIGVAIQIINAVNNTNSALYRNSSITSSVVSQQAITFSAVATSRCPDGTYDTTCTAPAVSGSSPEHFFGLTRKMFIIAVVSFVALVFFLIAAAVALLKRQRRKVEPSLPANVARVRRVPVKAAPMETSVMEDNQDFDSRWGVNSQHDWVPHTPPLTAHNHSSLDIPALNFQSLDLRMTTPSATPREKEIIKANTITAPPNSARVIRTSTCPTDTLAPPSSAEAHPRLTGRRLASFHVRDASLSTNDLATQQLAQAIAQHQQGLYEAHCRHIERLVSSSELPAANFLNAEEAVERRTLPGRYNSSSSEDGSSSSSSSSASDSSVSPSHTAGDETRMVQSPRQQQQPQTKRKKMKLQNCAGSVTANFVSLPPLVIPSPLSPSSPFSARSERKSPPSQLPPLVFKNALSVSVTQEMNCNPLSDPSKRTTALGLQSPVRQGFTLPALPSVAPFSPRMHQQPTPLSESYLENVQCTNNFFTDSTHALSTYSSCEALSLSQAFPPTLDLNAAPSTETDRVKPQAPKKRGMPKKRFPQVPIHLAAPSALSCTPSYPSSAGASSFSTPVPAESSPLPPPVVAPQLHPQVAPSPLSSLELRTLKYPTPLDTENLTYKGVSLSGSNPLRHSPGSMSSSLISRSLSNQNSTVKAILPQLSQLFGFSEVSPPAAITAPVVPQKLVVETRAVAPNNGMHFHFSRSLSNSPVNAHRSNVGDHSRVPSRFESHTITEGDIQHDDSMNYDDSRKSASVSPVHSEYVASRSSHRGKQHRRTISESPSFIEPLRKSNDAAHVGSVSARDDLSISAAVLPALPASLQRSRSFGAESVNSVASGTTPQLPVRAKQFAPED